MNDLGYRCLAHAIAEEIEGAAGSGPKAEAGAEPKTEPKAPI
jgi:hypothetical protein